MLKRKIDAELESFFADSGKVALLVTGARQVGKTFSIREFARRRFSCLVEINFIKMPSAKAIFTEGMTMDDFIVRLSALAESPMPPGETLVFFDEVQECPEIVTYIKFLVDDGRFRYALSGSLLGVELKNLRSAPVGYLREIQMFPLDLEEFVRAVGLKDEVFAHVRSCWVEEKPVDAIVHQKMMSLLRLYLVVGGMPAVVQKYIDTKNVAEVVKVQKSIIVEYRKDATKYAHGSRMDVLRVLELLPEELNKRSKRFHVADVKSGSRYERLEDNFIWLREAGIALQVCSVTDPRTPLRLYRNSNMFKLFMNDVGLLAAMYMDGIQLKLLNREKNINFGSVYENAAAQELKAHGYDLYYFNSKKQGELDFVIERGGDVLPIEIKSGKDYQRHAALDNVLRNKDYAIPTAFVFQNDNVSADGRVVYLPIYMLMFLQKEETSTPQIYKLNLDGLN